MNKHKSKFLKKQLKFADTNVKISLCYRKKCLTFIQSLLIKHCINIFGGVYLIFIYFEKFTLTTYPFIYKK